MDLIHGEGAGELFQAQSHMYKHICSFMNSMALKCAVQLGIPDIIHNHAHPTNLPQLVSALHIPPTKASCVHRLMRLLVHSGFFAIAKVHEHEEEEGYILTPSSRLLLKDNPTSNLSPFVLTVLHPVLVTPWHFFGDWLRGDDDLTAFETAHGVSFWDHGSHNPEIFNLFNEGLASDSQMMSVVNFRELKPVFEGLSSLVDLGGGTGLLARIISEVFPQLKCTVFDLPHVVANLPESRNLEYVGGDMFQSVPSADAILLKCVLHDWSDEDCLKILKKCREAIPREEERGKIIIIDIVINEKKDEDDIAETKLLMDMMMMTLVNGRERNEKEWEKLFLEAGFRHHKITPIFGLRSLIEVFP
ncbi:O-methyltransferase [Vitis vinifera]|uniref:O-methyltransferase n=1 Tax=Vitis vinifera TaxID=29760 RepID=A5HK00_VITVI|nr:O-methyltransferase [Vitis vinifera]ABQ02271.1 O-methyltransferase [Vitis vinifera]|eukprot:NP_001267964.1 O-methyltransferase [Vitis vinifera]